ncbi:hypothetical protein RJ639_002794 [Escallonia herrerae]|uniref:Poly(A) RNA polymerase mitochondrial-like central palm domain-containing protein n=1 Tax=Escallonia herrerae TaxID=1293975 RepID=A0AA88VZ63_9ASTE|nr:hypothetical protein RJ639_002794 [Escallonia herrerae]
MHNPAPKSPNNNLQPKPPSTHPQMDSKQLVDSLTSHISFYHSSSPPSNPNPRSSVLKWFSSLTVHQRQSYLTAVDKNFTQILLQMQAKLQSNGHGFFLILPDIPSHSHPHLPSLCFRKSHGLLSRASESNKSEWFIRESTWLFCSKEGETVSNECGLGLLDTITVSEKFVSNVDEFVRALDGVTSGGFLRGDGVGLGEEWAELEWLKAKGYYGIEAFVANRLEVALRLAWLSCCGNGKKRGVKLKENVIAVGVAANVFWRKKGCMDWWDKLDGAMRRKVLRMVLGKAAKSLTAGILKGTNSGRFVENETPLFGAGAEQHRSTVSRQRTAPRLGAKDAEFGSIMNLNLVSRKNSSLCFILNGLLVLQDLSTILSACDYSECDREKLFFSSLGSISTISDCIFRKLRGLLMVVSLDCTRLELLEDGKSYPTRRPKEKNGSASCRKKRKGRNMERPIPPPTSSRDDLTLDKPPKGQGYELMFSDNLDASKSNRLDGALREKGLDREFPSSAVDMPGGRLANGNVESTFRKNKKESKKLKKYGLHRAVEAGVSQRRTSENLTFPVISRNETANPDCVFENPVIIDNPNDSLTSKDKPVLNSSACDYTSGSTEKDDLAHTQGSENVGFMENKSDMSFKCYRPLDKITEDPDNRLENVNTTMDSSMPFTLMPVVELDVLGSEGVNCRNCGNLSEKDPESVFIRKEFKDVESEKEATCIQDQESFSICDTETKDFSGDPSHEWSSVAPIHFPSVHAHLPAATDRLHLDVGYNWKNQIHQVQRVHQARHQPTENGCNGILSRPLPLSLDWPPMVHHGSGLVPSVTGSYDSGFISRRQPSFQHGFTAQSMQQNALTVEDERVYSSDFVDFSELTNAQELADEHDNHWISEEEMEVHAVSGMDYSQYFGGGVMYWDPSDRTGTNFSRPPSLSSDDSSWAWREADMNRAVDDMVAFSSSYSTTGLTSPSASSFCSHFDPLGPAHQALTYVIPGSEVSGKLLHPSSAMTDVVAEEKRSGSLSNMSGDSEAKTGDLLPYPILRPIIIPSMSRERSRSEFKRSYDHKSPCVPPNRREQPQIKRPPSPVVLCVPRAPRPPPPSPVGDSRKHRGFPAVRSGSSSPRQWGVRGWFHDGTNIEESCARMDGSEVVWPTWRNKGLSARQLAQPLPGALLQDHLIAISQLARDQDHPDVAIPLQPPDLPNCSTHKASLSLMHNCLHDEIGSFCQQVGAENTIRKPYINWAVKRVTRSLQVLWPRSRTNIFGSNATGLSLPTSDVDLVVCLPPVRNLEPIKEAGILEGRNGIKETCLQHAARVLANQEWVKNDSLKIVENTAIPIIMLVVEVPHDVIGTSASIVHMKEELSRHSGVEGNAFQADTAGIEISASPKCSTNNINSKGVKSVRIDISFKSPLHTGLQTTELVLLIRMPSTFDCLKAMMNDCGDLMHAFNYIFNSDNHLLELVMGLEPTLDYMNTRGYKIKMLTVYFAVYDGAMKNVINWLLGGPGKGYESWALHGLTLGGPLARPLVGLRELGTDQPLEVKELTEQFPAATPLALVLKQFLADRSLDQSYSGGLSSYCLVKL